MSKKETIIVEIHPFNDDRLLKTEFYKKDLITDYNMFVIGLIIKNEEHKKLSIKEYIKERMIQTAEEFLIDDFLGRPKFKITMNW